MSRPNAGNGGQQKSQTDLEMEAGQKATERYRTSTPALPPKTNCSGADNPFPTGEAIDTGIVTAWTVKQPEGDGSISPTANTGTTCVQTVPKAALDFLDDFFGADKRHLVAIKKNKGKKPDIKAHHFDAADHAGQLKFITDWCAAGFDLLF